MDDHFHLSEYPEWVLPFTQWAEAPNGTRPLDFKGAEVPPTLQHLLINGLPGMSPEYGAPPKRKDPWDIDRISGLLASIVLTAICLSGLLASIVLVRWAW